MLDVYVKDLIIPKFDSVIMDVVDHKYTHYTFAGGRGSTKSSFVGIVIPLLITQNPTVHAAVFRKVFGTMRDSVYAQIVAGIGLLGMSEYFKCTVSPMEITYLQTGQKILFRGLDKPEKIKSIKTPFGYIGVTWFEELDQFAGRGEIRMVQQSTMRGGRLFWNFESFNPPITAANWANKDVVKVRKDRLVTWSNYLEVPDDWLGEQFFIEAEELKRTNERAYRHEYMGEAVGTGGNVFENAEVRKIDPKEWHGLPTYSGHDFGFAVDPDAFVRCAHDRKRGLLYLVDEFCATKLDLATLAKTLKVRAGRDIVTADSADPRSINELKSRGVLIIAARKGPDSIDHGIKWLQTLKKIVIDSSACPVAAEEFLQYEYDRDKEGNIISRYPDKNNHTIDAVRYAMESVSARKTAIAAK